MPYNQRTCYCGEAGAHLAGQTAILVGWVQSYRDHGGMVFIDLRDRTGLVQIKFNPETDPIAHQTAGKLRAEFCVAVRGDVAMRPEGLANPNLSTGAIEVNGREVEILSTSATPVFEVEDEIETNEETRLKYRYLDLRRTPMREALMTRHRICKTIRDYFDEQGFVEIETPFLTKSTPEGARDYLVPSRVHPGMVFALPQSPQLFKQLLMISGFDKYMQIVRCFRDEDLRADRQPEFTQLDMEMSFVQAEDVQRVIEGCMSRVMRVVHDIDIPTPFPRMTYEDAMRDYGIDRPDTRYELKIRDVSEAARGVDFRVFAEPLAAGGAVRCIVVPGGAQMTRKETDTLTEDLKGIGAGGLPLVKVGAGQDGKPVFETGIAKFFTPESTAAVSAASGAKPGDLILFAADTVANVCKYLGWLRETIARRRGMIPANLWNFLWVVDFPMFEFNTEDGRFYAVHHPFTAPRDEDIGKLENDPGSCRAKAYDVVLNGIELGGGSIRIHRADVQERVFDLLQLTPEEQQLKFRFLLEALRYGPPPHGGIALGIDRMVMLLTGASSLRDTFSFPKTQRAYCPLTEAPGPVAQSQLDELYLRLSLPPSKG
ncbi:MAG: aspartate--tRNA ligase [Phycisphaerales bacterium]|nr:aspartate--tRNA ligase [Phycisphaerales bacterium]